jgi:hypothetical protein
MDNNATKLIIVLVILIAILALGLYLLKSKKAKLSSKFKLKVKKYLQQIQKQEPSRQILEYDKLLDLCLKEKGLSGSLGAKMKRYGKAFYSENAIWQAHKLRNKLAHELDFKPSKSELQAAKTAFEKELKLMLK